MKQPSAEYSMEGCTLLINFPTSGLVGTEAFDHSRLFEFRDVFLDPAMHDADRLGQTCYGNLGICLHQLHNAPLCSVQFYRLLTVHFTGYFTVHLILNFLLLGIRKHHLDAARGDAENAFIVLLQDPAHTGAELLHQPHILKHTHEFAVARHTRKTEKVLLALPVYKTAVRCDLDPVRKDLKHGRDLTRVIVVNDGVDDRLTQRHAPDKSAVNALLARDLRAGDVLDLKLVQNTVRRLDERAIAVLLVLNEIDPLPAYLATLTETPFSSARRYAT